MDPIHNAHTNTKPTVCLSPSPRGTLISVMTYVRDLDISAIKRQEITIITTNLMAASWAVRFDSYLM